MNVAACTANPSLGRRGERHILEMGSYRCKTLLEVVFYIRENHHCGDVELKKSLHCFICLQRHHNWILVLSHKFHDLWFLKGSIISNNFSLLIKISKKSDRISSTLLSFWAVSSMVEVNICHLSSSPFVSLIICVVEFPTIEDKQLMIDSGVLEVILISNWLGDRP